MLKVTFPDCGFCALKENQRLQRSIFSMVSWQLKRRGRTMRILHWSGEPRTEVSTHVAAMASAVAFLDNIKTSQCDASAPTRYLVRYLDMEYLLAWQGAQTKPQAKGSANANSIPTRLPMAAQRPGCLRSGLFPGHKESKPVVW